MAKKQFDTKSATSKFFTSATDNNEANETSVTQTTDSTGNTQEKHYKQNHFSNRTEFPRRQGRPKKQPEDRKRTFRYNLLLDNDLNQYLHEIVWIRRTNMTQYVNDLIRADYENYIRDCQRKGTNPFEGWKNPNDV